jgi:integrase
MSAKLEKTSEKGIYRRHRKECPRSGRCKCSYVVVWRHRNRQHKETFRTYQEAREAKGARAAGESRPASRERFSGYARAWIDSYRGRTERGIGDRTRASYGRDLENHAIPFLGSYKLGEIEPPDVRAFVVHLEGKGMRPGAVRRALAPVRALFATAVEDGALPANPAREVRVGGRRDDDGREVRALTRAELGRLLAELPDHYVPFFGFLAHTGLRISEAIGLQWRDVKFGDKPRIEVRRQDYRGDVGKLKTNAARRDLPLSPGTARRLWAGRRTRRSTDRVFVTPSGTPIMDGNLRRNVLVPSTERAGLGRHDADGEWRTWVGFHTFRHTCASLLFVGGEDGENRKDIKQVAAWLGHSDPSFTLRTYIHLMDDGIGDADFLDEAVKPARGNTGATEGPQTAANATASKVA